jgi:hypothetical protein
MMYAFYLLALDGEGVGASSLAGISTSWFGTWSGR